MDLHAAPRRPSRRLGLCSGLPAARRSHCAAACPEVDWGGFAHGRRHGVARACALASEDSARSPEEIQSSFDFWDGGRWVPDGTLRIQDGVARPEFNMGDSQDVSPIPTHAVFLRTRRMDPAGSSRVGDSFKFAVRGKWRVEGSRRLEAQWASGEEEVARSACAHSDHQRAVVSIESAPCGPLVIAGGGAIAAARANRRGRALPVG